MRRFLIGFLVLLPGVIGADGAAFKMGLLWERVGEDTQRALIDWRDGRQRMALAVRLDLARSDSGVWLVPVRGRPDQVRVELGEGMPSLIGGFDAARAARKRVEGARTLAMLTSLPGTPLSLLFGLVAVPTLLEHRISAKGGEEWQTVSRDGLQATILPAVAPAELSALLRTLDRSVPAEQLSSFTPYADGAHSILAVRIDPQTVGAVDGSRWKERTPAALLDFPSAEPWFPMRASAGGSGTVVLLALAGWWTAPDLRCTTRMDVEWDASASGDPAACAAWLGWPGTRPPERLTYGVLHAGTAKDFAADLVFTARDAAAIERGLWLGRLPTWLCLLGLVFVLAVVGTIAGAVAGQLLLRRAGWGAAIGSTYGVLGPFVPWLCARRDAMRQQPGVQHRCFSLRWWFLPVVPVCLLVAVGACMSEAGPMVGVIAIIGCALSYGIFWWAWARGGDPVDGTSRRLLAWVHVLAAIGFLLQYGAFELLDAAIT